MKRAISINFVLAVCLLVGCATSTATSGNDFDSSKVAQIEKGVTTTDQLVAMFGQPYSKHVKGDTDEEWLFLYVTATSKARAVPFGGTTVNTTGHQKTLTVLVRDETVVNYTYHEGPIQQDANTQTYR